MEEEVFDEEECEDDTAVLIRRYDEMKNQKIEDITAMQTVLCLLAGLFLSGIYLFSPELFLPVFEKIRSLMNEEKEIMPNLIDVVMKLWK